jgi:hypothetical protein
MWPRNFRAQQNSDEEGCLATLLLRMIHDKKNVSQQQKTNQPNTPSVYATTTSSATTPNRFRADKDSTFALPFTTRRKMPRDFLCSSKKTRDESVCK